MTLRLFLIAALAFGVAACGTKTPLERPDGQKSTKTQNPSEPPNPIQR